MHKIKKYANRKMYDTTDKKYISMDKLAKLIKSGKEVSIIDNQTGEDLTTSIVSQLIARDRNSQDKVLSSKVLIDLLRKGGDTLSDYAKKYVSLWQGALTMAEDEVDKLVNLLVKDKELSKSEGRNLKNEIVGYTETLKTWIQENIDRRLNEVLSVMNLASKDQVEDLAARIDQLNRKVERLEPSRKKKINSHKNHHG
ncbi:MAG: polyhydroxyalkanoate synthesis regulator DNA-binding domain-containing protein [Pseudomonadota bacterium]